MLDGAGPSTLQHAPSSKKNFRGEQTELLKLNAPTRALSELRWHRHRSRRACLLVEIYNMTKSRRRLSTGGLCLKRRLSLDMFWLGVFL